MQKILIIRLGAIGDVIHTSNVYRAIKKAHPDVEIHFLTSINKALIENDKTLSKVWTIKAKNLKVFSKYFIDYTKLLKAENFDIVINLQPSVKTRLLAFLAGIKKRYNYHKNNKIHAVTNYWQTAKRVFNDIEELPELEITLAEDVCEKINKMVENYQRPFVILNCGHVFAKRQGRTYPITKWIELGNKIQEKYNGTIFITGLKEDAEILEPLNSIKNSVSFVDKLSLEETSALIKTSDLLLSGDSGPLHIATALKTKVVGLFGSMPIARTGPYGNNHCVVVSKKSCVPCNRRKCKYLDFPNELYSPCMCEIDVNEILEKISL